MKYKVRGQDLPLVDIELEPGEHVFTESGGMSWMSANMQMETNTRGGVMGGIGRMLAGESLFLTSYFPEQGKGLVSFASEFPGKVIPMKLKEGERIIAQKDAFMVAEGSVTLKTHFRKRLGTGLFGREGFFLQEITGPGQVFLELAGEVTEYKLESGQQLKVDQGYIAAYEPSVDFDLTEKKKCVILAGGKAANLFDDGEYRPLFKGKTGTLIEDIISKVHKAGYGDILIVGSKEVLSAIYKIVGEDSSGCAIEYVEEKQHLGTAKTLQLVRQKIKGTFLFVPCDHYFELDLKDMEEYHKRNHGEVTLAVYSGTKYAWSKSSIVELEGNRIKTYEENPKENKTFLTSLLIGIAEPEMFDHIPLAQITYSLQEDVFPEIAKDGNLIGYVFSGKWKNVHDKKDIIF
jgi:uncharacterized protein (TIGR00266 family)|tara:strand:- start:187 stop:1398 length:1212 start_codon:yes stop_codon:yes gene_type:complete